MIRDYRAHSQKVEDTTVCPTDISFGVVKKKSVWNDSCKNERTPNGSREGIADNFEAVRKWRKDFETHWSEFDEKDQKMKSSSAEELKSDYEDKKGISLRDDQRDW